MCFPAVGIALGLASSVVGAMGAMAEADGAAKQAEYNAKVAEINARTARQQGSSEADKVEDKYQRLKSGQRVAAAKAGLDPSMGSAALVINQETTRNSELDQLTSIWNRETEAIGFENKAKDLRIQGQNAKTAGKYKAAGTFLSGLGGAADKIGRPGSTLSISG